MDKIVLKNYKWLFCYSLVFLCTINVKLKGLGLFKLMIALGNVEISDAAISFTILS